MRVLTPDQWYALYGEWDPMQGELPSLRFVSTPASESEFRQAEKIISDSRLIIERVTKNAHSSVLKCVYLVFRDSGTIATRIGQYSHRSWKEDAYELWQLAAGRADLLDFLVTDLVGVDGELKNYRPATLAAIAIAEAWHMLEELLIDYEDVPQEWTQEHFRNAQAFYNMAALEFSDGRTQRAARAANSRYDDAKLIACKFADGTWIEDPTVPIVRVVDEIHAMLTKHFSRREEFGKLKKRQLPTKKTIRGWIRDLAPPSAVRIGRPPKTH